MQEIVYLRKESYMFLTAINPSAILQHFPQEFIIELISSSYNTIELKVILVSKPELIFITRILMKANLVAIQINFKLPLFCDYSIKSALMEAINSVNINNPFKLRFDIYNNNIIVDDKIYADHERNEKINNGSTFQINLQIAKTINKLIEKLSNTLEELKKFCGERQTKNVQQFTCFTRAFQKQRINRQKSTKLSILNLEGMCMSQSICQIFSFYQDKRKMYNNYKRIKEYTDSEQKKKQQHFQKRLKSSLHYFEKIRRNYDEQAGQLWKKNILTGAKIYNVTEQKNYHQQKGFFGSIQKIECSMINLQTSNGEVQKILESQEDLSTKQQKKRYSLIRKSAKQIKDDFRITMETQVYILKFLRDKKCRQIAEYFMVLNDIKSSEHDNLTLYSKYYAEEYGNFPNNKMMCLSLADLCLGLSFLLKNKLIHRDLKPDNLRIQRQKGIQCIKIIDFGSSCPIYGQNWQLSNDHAIPRTTREYSLHYSEIYGQIEKTMNKVEFDRHYLYDIYAFGKIASLLFSSCDSNSNNTVNYMKKYLIGKCLQANPQDRLNPNQILTVLYYIISLTDYQFFYQA